MLEFEVTKMCKIKYTALRLQLNRGKNQVNILKYCVYV